MGKPLEQYHGQFGYQLWRGLLDQSQDQLSCDLYSMLTTQIWHALINQFHYQLMRGIMDTLE